MKAKGNGIEKMVHEEDQEVQARGEEQAAPALEAVPEEVAAPPAEPDREELKRLLQRVQADFANYRKRSEEEHRENEQQSNARLLSRLLPVLDEFELAIDHAQQASADESWLDGVRLIHRKLSSLLESEGVARIEALGREFDPFEHEAVLYQETEKEQEGTVIDVLQGGYKLHGRVLRPARVIVAKGASSEGKEEK